LDRHTQFHGGVLGGEHAGGRAVVEPGALPAVTLPWGRNGVLSASEVLHRGAGTRRLVGGRQAPAEVGVAGGHGHQVGLDLAGGVGRGELAPGDPGVGVAAGLGEVREAVVQVLGGLAHDQGGLVDDLLGDDPRVGVDALTHGVAAHVLDAAGDGDVDGPETDRGGDGRDGGHRTGAHPVDGVARGGLGQAGEQPARRPRVRPWSPIWVVAAIATSSTRSLGSSGCGAATRGCT
jgi:hypothetical protein